MSSLPGITRQDEEKRLQHTLEIAQRKVDANRQSVQALAEELHAMQEEFDENDKEAQALWHNADARFKFVNQDLRRAEQANKITLFPLFNTFKTTLAFSLYCCKGGLILH